MIVHYVVDDGEVFNVFSSDMFDSLGRYYEDTSINFRDLDIVARYYDMDEAFRHAEQLNEITMDREMLKRIEVWALEKSPYLSMKDYSRGFHDGIEHAKDMVLTILMKKK